MKRIATKLVLLATTLALGVACQPRGGLDPIVEDRGRVPEAPADGESDPYSAAMLEEYRAALPTVEELKAPQAQSDMQAQLGDPAVLPRLAAPQVTAVNVTVIGLVATLEIVTAFPPTFYNSDTQEFVWGPMDDDKSALAGDKVAVYVKDNGEDAEMRYSYAFIRGMGNDMATYQPVIWGATTPRSDENTGHGLVLFDLEANNAFLLANGAEENGQGRFAIAYGRNRDENSGAMVSIVLSTFRDFKGGEAPAEQVPSNTDQLYGHVVGTDGNKIDFASIQAQGHVHPAGDNTSALEDIDLRLVLANGGPGRAEAIVSGGDVEADSVVTMTECWDALIARTYVNISAEGAVAADQPDGVITIAQEGEESLCGDVLSNTLADLEIPSLDDVDPAHLAALDEIASNGIQ
jgi:hypothetical protein